MAVGDDKDRNRISTHMNSVTLTATSLSSSSSSSRLKQIQNVVESALYAEKTARRLAQWSRCGGDDV